MSRTGRVDRLALLFGDGGPCPLHETAITVRVGDNAGPPERPEACRYCRRPREAVTITLRRVPDRARS